MRNLASLWKDEYPSANPRRHSLIEKIICTIAVLISFLSLANIKVLVRKKFPESHLFMDMYVLGWLLLLLFSLFRLTSSCPKWVLALAIYRIIDILDYRVLFLFLKSEERPWTPSVIRRSVAIALVNFAEVVLAFAVIYAITGSIGQGVGGVPIQTPSDCLYFSLVTMTTVGFGDIVPLSSTGRWIVMSEICCMIVFVIFLLPALMSVFSPELRPKQQ